ncbi:SDR family NAD(P)-dependent oxidoreductase [Aquibacillus salsiterrae]|uniref:SDR family oxidoreductase n=1 Tax=Aquibacillus salsiterrae TaxID=2950439 RepID=A0A9X3WAE7_9BACI|nr:SDR family oxidoreductase [Aquibacillus salsiterrae]MDC3415445.1 SDR family oxidoreductase [Aquibacillus salsiterrae]
MTLIKDNKIIITGASSGIGEQLAKQIAKHGGIPIMLARNEQRLAKIHQEIWDDYQIDCEYYVVDLTNLDSYRQALDHLLENNNQIAALINNAGVGKFDYVDEAKNEDNEMMIQLNVLAMIEGVRVMLPHFVSNKWGHIINIGSQAGKIATPKSAVYSATKHAVIGFSNGLRLEVQDKGVFVTTVNIGPVKTNFFSVADPSGNYQQAVKRFMLDPEDVAIKVVDALFTPKREINLPKWMDAGSKLYQLFPGLMERFLKKQFNKK